MNALPKFSSQAYEVQLPLHNTKSHTIQKTKNQHTISLCLTNTKFMHMTASVRETLPYTIQIAPQH